MTEHDGTTIWKYPIELDGVTTIDLPAHCKKLDMQVDKATNVPTIWIELNPQHPTVRTLELQVVVTGGRVPLGEYEGTFQIPDPSDGSDFVGHVYSIWQ